METMIKKIRHTFSLISFTHTIFALPFALASMILAANGLPSLRIVLLIVGCMICARTSAMAFNRFADAKIDAQNPRTENRHIPAGTFSRGYVLVRRYLLAKLFHASYGRFVLPILGGLVSGNLEAYRYLRDSIQNYYDVDSYKKLMAQVGFKKVQHKHQIGGASTMVWGHKGK